MDCPSPTLFFGKLQGSHNSRRDKEYEGNRPDPSSPQVRPSEDTTLEILQNEQQEGLHEG